MATAPSPNDLTRQQLDELDALLQRMLTLPLNAPESPPPTPGNPTSWRVDSPATTPAPPPHISAPPLPTEVPNPFAAPISPPPEPPAPLPFAEPVSEIPPPLAPLPPDPVPERSVPLPVSAPAIAVPPPEPATPVVERPDAGPSPEVTSPDPLGVYGAASPPEPLPSYLWPLVAFNWIVDSILGLFGLPGRLLRSGFGKNLLGLIGIGLLLYTAAHLLTDMGLLSLPFSVPWPR